MMSYTITVRPAAGPLTCSGQPAIVPTTNPPMMPVIRPAATGAPDAIAIPMHNGRATRNTTIEAKKSFLKSNVLDPALGGERFMVEF